MSFTSVELAARIRHHLEAVPGTEVVDLHVWEIGPKACACLASVIATPPHTSLEYADKLRATEDLAHVTVEVNLRLA